MCLGRALPHVFYSFDSKNCIVEHKTAIKREITVLEIHTSLLQEKVNLRLVPNDTNHLEKMFVCVSKTNINLFMSHCYKK
jgi:hypothetical protein